MLNNASARQWLSPATGQTKLVAMSRRAPSLADFRRLVVKVGSSLLVDSEGGRLHKAWLSSLADDLAGLHRNQCDVLVVSSGAIALGRAVLKLPAGPLKLEDSQAAAAVGQIALARTWSEVLGRHDITAGQVLVTLQDTEERRRYLNARSTIEKLLEWRAVPVINENDTVATNEIRYGDNDRLAPNSRAAGCRPKSKPPRSRRRAARTWSLHPVVSRTRSRRLLRVRAAPGLRRRPIRSLRERNGSRAHWSPKAS